MFINTKTQGDAGLGRAIAWAIARGYSVSLPLTDSQDYDLVMNIAGELKRIQVKTGTSLSKRNIPIVRLAVCGGNKSSSKRKTADMQVWDMLFCWHITADKMFFIPKDKLESKDTLTLGLKYQEFQVAL